MDSKSKSSKWVLQPEEKPDDYYFVGSAYITNGVKKLIPNNEIIKMITEVHNRVAKNNGAFFLQVFRNENGEEIYIEDNISKKFRDNNQDQDLSEIDYFTVMLPEER